MKRALRWTRLALLGNVAILIGWQVVLLSMSLIGVDIQPLKWPTVFYSGVLLLLAVALSVVALTLQIVVAVQRRFAEQ